MTAPTTSAVPITARPSGCEPNIALPSRSKTRSCGSSSYIAISSSTTSRSASSSPKRGQPDHLAHHVERPLEVAVEHARVERRGLLVGAGVDLRAHRVEDLVDLLRADSARCRGTACARADARCPPRPRPRSTEPVAIQKPSATERTLGTRSVTTRTPESSVVIRCSSLTPERSIGRSRPWRGRPEPRSPSRRTAAVGSSRPLLAGPRSGPRAPADRRRSPGADAGKLLDRLAGDVRVLAPGAGRCGRARDPPRRRAR